MWFALSGRARTTQCRLLFSCLLFTCVRAYAVDQQDDSSNITYLAPHSEHLPSMFSPRMDFEQWKPLTGRGDPLQNDPTYDYDPPKLDRVHYWIDPAASNPEEKIKSEVLVLGVSSKKPSVVQPNIKRDDIGGAHKYMTKIPNYMHYPFSRPNMPPRHRPTSHVTFPTQSNKVKYEDYSYKITDSNPIPMTILVPPPPPPPGQVQSTFYEIINEQQQQSQNLPSTSEATSYFTISTTMTPTEQVLPETSPSLFVQEANLIYQSSTVDQNWDYSINASNVPSEPTMNSDYEGWGPTVPPEFEESNNDTQNLINSDHFDIIRHPYSFYRPMFSEAPPPPQPVPGAIFEPLSQTTELPTSSKVSENVTPSQPTSTPITPPHNTLTTKFQVTETVEVSTERQKIFEPTPVPPVQEPEQGIFAMLGPMFGMPMTDGPQRPEDNLYAHGTENLHVFKQPTTTQESWDIELESMQTMQPPPVTVTTERMPVNYQHNLPTRSPEQGFLQTLLYKEKSPLALTSGTMKYPIFKPVAQTPPTTTTVDPVLGNLKIPNDINVAPMYLIIQGHSKVKTYGSKPKGSLDLKDAIDNEIPQSKESQQVKHLHPLKEDRATLKSEVKKNEVDRSKNGRSLNKLVSDGVGKIEIQEADLGIQYDVSDGSGVPAEIYRKGFVDNEENDYTKARKNQTTTRRRRQLDLEDILPIDEENIEEYVYNYLKNKSKEKSLTGLIAAAVTSEAAEAVDDLEPDVDEEDEAEDEQR